MITNGLTATPEINPMFEANRKNSPEEKVEEAAETEEILPEDQDFMALYEESLSSIQEGKVIEGEIIRVDKEYVLVDIGYKSEGQIRIHEFIDPEGHLTAKVGDKIDVLLVRKEDKEGQIILSKERALRVKVWNEIEEAYKSNGTVRGKIKATVKGGFFVDIGLEAFLPGSHADIRPIRNLESLVGGEHDFKILTYDKRKGNIVLSRRAVLESERMALREKTLERIEKDAILEGLVKNITHYGLFVDLGGIDGFVHITDMSWGKIHHPSEIAQIGDEIKVKVLKFDKERERVSLGMKQLTPDPWAEAQERYPAGTTVKGRISSLKNYGAFVEVEQGLEGLIHVSEMSWTNRIKDPSQILKIDDTVDALVLNVDPEKRRLSLGLKQLQQNPWDTIAEKFPVGTIIEGKIKNITEFGLFIGIDDGIDGLIHVSDISWNKAVKNPLELYRKGQAIQAVVMSIDKEKERFSLGIKQLTPDPWDEIPEKYKPGTKVNGTVTTVADFGVFVELQEGVEGLIHVSELSKSKGENSPSQFQVGDAIQARVLHVSPEDKKIGLSIRRLVEDSGKQVYGNYVNNRTEVKSNLGELLREGLKNLNE